MKVSPSSPKRGEPVKVVAKGILTKPVSSGSYDLHVKLGSSEIYKHEGPMCGDSSAEVIISLSFYSTNVPRWPSSFFVYMILLTLCCFTFLFATHADVPLYESALSRLQL